MITIYTDGSSRGNPGPGGWAAIIDGKEIGGYVANTTNNRMELTAVIEALKNSTGSVTIYSDSEYVIKGITEWIHGWIKRDWKKVMNRDLWEKLYDLAENRDIEWKHVRGHSGDKYNERADKIATMYADGKNMA